MGREATVWITLYVISATWRRLVHQSELLVEGGDELHTYDTRGGVCEREVPAWQRGGL